MRKSRNKNTVRTYREKPKTVSKRYIVTSQTAYHITELALMEGTTEGRIVDKLMRTYLASRDYSN